MSNVLPLIPLKDIVMFPHMMAPISVGREKSINAAQIAIQADSNIILALQKNPDIQDPTIQDVHSIGIQAKILQFSHIAKDSMKLIVESIKRTKILTIEEAGKEDEQYYQASYEDVNMLLDNGKIQDYKRQIANLFLLFTAYMNLKKTFSQDIDSGAIKKSDPNTILDVICANITSDLKQKQSLLEETDFEKKIDNIHKYLAKALPNLEIEKDINEKIKTHIEKTQREFYIKEKIYALQKELEKSTGASDTTKLQEKIDSLNMPKHVKEVAMSELEKYKNTNHMSAEASITRNYLDVLISLPWGKVSQNTVNIEQAEQILNNKHYGLEHVKETILEYISVIRRSYDVPNFVLLLVGPPGVGKTSLAKTIAQALGREYVKCSLGGVHSEAEIRGHRKTYIGAMPGKIITALQKVKTDNPVILLDEIDKMGSDFRGDPAAAFLEILDIDQNKQFLDNYLGVEYDLSKIFFICTANSLNIQRPLLDRVGVLKIPGYSQEEKLNIATKHLIPKQLKLYNTSSQEINITDGAIKKIIKDYTKESGVRELDRQVSSVIRKAIRLLAKSNATSNKKNINISNITNILGPAKYSQTKIHHDLSQGSCIGLAYTEYGGTLTIIESVLTPGEGKLKTTGKLGEVMQESAKIALTYFKSIAKSINIAETTYKDYDIHMHFPEGAVPKDGPSAGIAILTAIVSLMSQKKAKNTIAMTGEITLTGKVLAIGGLREKLLAAYTEDINNVIIPEANLKDLTKIPKYITKKINVMGVSHAKEVLKLAFDA